MSILEPLNDFLNFEIYDFGSALVELLHIEEDEVEDPLLKRIEVFGLESTQYIKNEGTIIVFYFIYIILLSQVFLTALLCPREDTCRRVSRYLKPKVMYSSLIVVIEETRLISSVCLLIGFQNLSIASKSQTF